ncbi:MAG: bifunctional hydroxymethylpyrimidine kinase/phosphomethylpyrimidine kinase [Candidatus Eisenbacteria bacterium]|nr:bifunctional hydroxymethylpyrimidine kinase/phosphomethylpyrimidine kinase [Candidatus Eisenbacteria bacterium]
MKVRTPIAITIAGSDSCGGAGIEADLKTMSAFRVYGAAAITAVTAQNTVGVIESLCLEPALVEAQIDAVMDDIGVDAAKTGMLGTPGIVRVVADAIRRREIPNVVVDPVMVATSGARLADDDAVQAFIRVLIPLATVVTPNVPEAEALCGMRIRSVADMEEAARRIHSLGAASVLVKGGHLEHAQSAGAATDVLFDGSAVTRLVGRRVPGGKIHGTGCTLSAAIASGLAIGWDVSRAVARAKGYVADCIAGAFSIGKGSALINHFAVGEEG